MKSVNPKFILLLLCFVLLPFGFTGCVVHHGHGHPRHRTVVVKEKRIPPGQVKRKHKKHHHHGH